MSKALLLLALATSSRMALNLDGKATTISQREKLLMKMAFECGSADGSIRLGDQLGGGSLPSSVQLKKIYKETCAEVEAVIK